MAHAYGRFPCLLLLGLFLIAAIAAALHTTNSRPARPSLLEKVHASYEVIDLRSGHYRVEPVLSRRAGGNETFYLLVQRLKPYAAISGTYHDPEYRVLGDLLSGGKLIARGRQRQGIGFTDDGRIVFRERAGRAPIDWTGCVSGLACGPRLVRAGKADVNVVRDGFREVAAQRAASRCAAGATSDGKLVLCLVQDAVTLDEMAAVMLKLGARDAINLDGGAMCAFYADGRFAAEPVAKMSNLLAVYRK